MSISRLSTKLEVTPITDTPDCHDDGRVPEQGTDPPPSNASTPEATPVTDRTSLQLPPQMPMEEWQHLGKQIFTFNDSSSWWLGDWLSYGQANYPDRYKTAIAETGLSYQTLRNYAWVTRQFPAQRRHSNLSFQHHAEVVGMSQDEQDRWLDRVEKFGWSRNELRRRIKASLQSFSPESPTETSVQMRVDSAQKKQWEAAARTNNQDLTSWMVRILNEAASTTMTDSASTDLESD